jgi:hypothetical protein
LTSLIFEGGPENATKVISTHFNDQNREESSLYFNDWKNCDFIIDLVSESVSDLEPNFLQKYPDIVEELISFEYLDVKASDRLFRAFYVPFLSPANTKFTKYVLMKNKIRERERHKLR